MKKLWPVLALLVVGCGGNDLSSPRAAVESFVDAAGDRDAERLAECVSKDAAGEFAALREGKADEGLLGDLQETFADAAVEDESVDGDRAEVLVRLSGGREERISLVREGDDWRILDF